MFRIQGKVVVKETGAGIPGLIVHVFDLDQASQPGQTAMSAEERIDRSLPYDSLGSVLTETDGSFFIPFEEQDFNLSGKELRPELYLIVSRPEDENEKPASLKAVTLYLSRPIRFKAGKIESYHIRISKASLDKHQIIYPGSTGSAQYQLKGIETDAAARKELHQGLKQVKSTITQKVDAAFAGFQLSAVRPEVQNSKNYLKPGGNLSVKQNNIATEQLGILAGRSSAKHMTLRLTRAELEAHGLWRDGRPIAGEIPSPAVKQYITGSSLQRESFQPCIKTFTEDNLTSFDSTPTPPANPSPGAEPPAPTGSINGGVQLQLETATSPETALKYQKVVDQDYKNDKVCETVNQLSLCGGPADVTSYHDFHSVQIAFEHVWTEIFDKELEGLGKRLFAEAVTLDEGYREMTIGGDFNWGPLMHYTFSSVNDLAELASDLIPHAQNNEFVRDLIAGLQQRMAEKYRFTVFAPNSVNYGVVFTFRQKWEPVNYQVGKLVSSLPLAPKESRKYASKRVVTKSKNEKFLDDREFKGKTESSSTSRAESEIIKRATNNTSFGMNTSASVNMEMFEAGVETNMSNSSERFSQDTKKNFREAVLNAVEEYRKQNKTEVEFGWKDELTTESSGEISNPNDEITVTYLFYELQRQYDISEQLHKIQPVILVANEVPMPNEIDTDWLMANAWILRRVILDESFLPILNQLSSSSIGDNLAIKNLKSIITKQNKIVDALIRQIESKNEVVNSLFGRLQSLVETQQGIDNSKAIFDMGRAIIDPIGSLLGGMGGGSETPSLDKIKEFTEMAIDRAEKENKELTSSLNKEQSYLQQVTEKYNRELQQYFDKQASIMQLRIHVKENILYYMQAIWDYEPPDQRYFRLYNQKIAWFEPAAEPAAYTVRIRPGGPLGPRIMPGGRYELELTLSPAIRMLPASVERKLVEVADLDKLLGYKGNYMIFPVKENSYLHEYMIQEFIDNATGGIRDADDFANYKTQDLIDYLKCVKQNNPGAFEQEKDYIIALINERLQSPRKEKERIVIPTNSLFIEALPGKHPVMEDFKLAHRALDVKKVQAEVRHAELENLRLAARLLEGEREDPDIEKIIIKK